VCSGAKYIEPSGKEWKVYFPNPKAALPVALKDGTIEWVKWGRRKEEQAPFVQGGWARVDSIEVGKWERYNPQFVILAAQGFMEKDAEKVSHWIDVPQGFAIQALVVQNEWDKRLYIVTEDTPDEYSWVHDRWPRMIGLNHEQIDTRERIA
jgi:hypothetical protein